MALLRFLAFALVALVLLAPRAQAQEGPRLVESDIKAGLLYNFLRYTQWPAGRDDEPIVVCVYGRDPFQGRLAPMQGRTVNQRPIQLRTVRRDAELEACSLLFLNAEEREEWPRLQAHLARRSVLTVSDYEGFARSGGMLEFTRVNNRIGVRLNVAAAQAVNLSVQDRLLRLASIVETGRP